MTLEEFLEKWNGKYCEVTGSPNAKNQCVDLANAYIRDVWNLPIVEWTNAKDFPSRITDCTFIENTPNGIPNEGDLVVWDNGTAGHIAIFLESININRFYSFDENYPLGSPCHVQGHTYANVCGWLRSDIMPPVVNNDNMSTEPVTGDQTLIDLGSQIGILEIQLIRSIILDSRREKENLERELSNLKQKIHELLNKVKSYDE